MKWYISCCKKKNKTPVINTNIKFRIEDITIPDFVSNYGLEYGIYKDTILCK